MDPSTLLSQLRDVHAPDPVSFWPLAIGWWLLLALSFILLTSLVLVIAKKRLNNTWKRQARNNFYELSEAYSNKPSTGNLLAISRLLKQSLSTAKQSRHYLQLCGSDWASELRAIEKNSSSILQETEITILVNDIYSTQASKLDKEALERISVWIKHLG